MSCELSIIIVNWNGGEFLPGCIESIVQNPPGCVFEIVVVDNASTDKSIEWFRSEEAQKFLYKTRLTLIESKKNLGFGKANNMAIERTSSPYVFLLNPDTIIKQNAIDKLLETLKSDDKIGAVAPKLLNTDGTLQRSVWQFPPNPVSILVEGLKLYKFIPKRLLGNWLYSTHWNYQERKAVPVFSGAAIMAKREMIDQVGAFDKDFHMYGEDVEWCVRINRSGWKTFFEPDAEVFHLGGQSSVQRWGSSESRLKEEEGFIYCQRKCLSKPLFISNLLTRVFVLTLYYIKNFVAGKNYTPLAMTIKLYLRSLRSVLKIT